MASRAQVSIELITALVMILLILIVITLYSIEKSVESRDLRTFIDAKRVCTSIADNLDAIQRQGRGYYKYFNIPERIEGGYAYNISINKNVVEVSWGEKAWAVTTIASNVTVYCVEYGLSRSNRIRNEGDHLSVTCQRPNLRPLGDSLEYWQSGGNVTLSLEVENDGHEGSGAFDVLVDGTLIPVGGLEAYGRAEVNHTIAGFPVGGYTVVINADDGNLVEESIESDNAINHTINI